MSWPLPSVVSWNTVISVYSRVCLMDKAMSLLKEMLVVGSEPNASTVCRYIVVLSNLKLCVLSCVQLGDFFLASSVHSLVLKCGCGEADSIQNLLMTMYANCGNLIFARRIFDVIVGKSVLSWTSMIVGYARSGHPSETLNLFRRTVQTSLIHMYSKCGSIKKATEVFDSVKDKDLTDWTSIINSYAIHGMGDEAISLFEKITTLEGLKPDAIVYTRLLLACSHSGLIEDGLKYFKSMQTDFGITHKIGHYTCLVDLLGRVGQLELPLDAIQAMSLELQARAWGSLLSACRIHGNIELGELAAIKLLELSPGSSRSYVLMANLYTSVGKFIKANTMRNLIDGKSMVKDCGWSQVQVSG
ncbi:pentatricopeptide repeat-containing protein At4g33990-like [Cicer arietinum]|uniref:Pentatricopeptide repeat-containing protein At4g33990-like n=1 Tax=Cicer arietinum TaxID=3827 RepID=A0A3Q7XX70_CICAR|nr:pentatricopeptide repeat-containing protein At4g33990-like [Cicer arietinum]